VPVPQAHGATAVPVAIAPAVGYPPTPRLPLPPPYPLAHTNYGAPQQLFSAAHVQPPLPPGHGTAPSDISRWSAGSQAW
jgi:hypothetical protein